MPVTSNFMYSKICTSGFNNNISLANSGREATGIIIDERKTMLVMHSCEYLARMNLMKL